MSFKRLENIALHYIARYEATAAKLREVLRRRVKNSPNADEVPADWIDRVVEKMVAAGYVDDKRFAENLIRRAQESGKSARHIAGKLKLAGLKPADFMESDTDTRRETEQQSADLFVQKKRLAWKKGDYETYRKHLGKMARAGFDYEASKQALLNVMAQEE